MRHLPVRALFACMAVSAIALTACLAPPSPYTEQEQAALHSVFSQNARSFQQSVEAACTKARKLAGTVPEIAPQEGAPSSGTFPRTASGCFVGQTKWYTSPFDGTGLRVYDQGVYVEADTGMSPQEIFEGKFLFLSNRPEATGRGTYVMVGRRTRADGREQVGIFVAESVTSYLDLIPADKPYLDRIEQKHKQQVIAFREEQRRRAQSERSNFSFGQALALGLGGAAILSTGIPAEQMIEVGAAFTTDILTDGEAGALDELNGQYRTELENSRASHESEQRSSAAAGSGCGGYNDGGIHDGQAKSFCQSAYNYSCQGHDQGIQASCEMLLKLSETDHSKCSYCR